MNQASAEAFSRSIQKENIMSKEQKSNKETKKKPLLTAKEKKAAKKAKPTAGKTVSDI